MTKRFAIVLAAVAALVAIGCSSAPKSDPVDTVPAATAKATPPTTRPTTAATTEPANTSPPAPLASVVEPGTWAVPSEVEPGTYVATAGDYCYWARLKNFDGELDSIAANGNLDAGERGRFTVKKTDKGLELTGDCTWVLTKK